MSIGEWIGLGSLILVPLFVSCDEYGGIMGISVGR
jgi:hypothetical protein